MLIDTRQNTHMALNLTTINIDINGANVPTPVPTGTTGNQFLRTKTYADAFQIPANVEVLVNGASGRGDLPLGAGDTLTFQTKASSKAVGA